MRKRSVWVLALAVLVVAGLFVAAWFKPWIAAATVVAAETTVSGPVTRVLAVNGRIAAVRTVEVRPLVNGTLTGALAEEGQAFKAGEEVARIDAIGQQAIVRQAMAGLDAALVAQDEAVATYARTKALGANAARMVLDNAARAEQSAGQEVARMTALLDQAEIVLGHFVIRAPISGTVLVRQVDPGQIVDLATVLMTVADLSALVVETDVDESYATQIHEGQTAALQLSGETLVRPGNVSFVSQKVDPSTGGLVVKLTPEVAMEAPVGLTVTANITVDSVLDAITVPRAALVTDAQGAAVFVLSAGKAERRAVTVIEWPAARLIVTGGLVPGEVVIADATGLVAGQAVAQGDP